MLALVEMIMQITVKLFSVLRAAVPDYDPDKGLRIELDPQARVEDLIDHLKIPGERFPVVSCDGHILQKQDLLADGSVLHIFQPVAGG